MSMEDLLNEHQRITREHEELKEKARQAGRAREAVASQLLMTFGVGPYTVGGAPHVISRGPHGYMFRREHATV